MKKLPIIALGGALLLCIALFLVVSGLSSTGRVLGTSDTVNLVADPSFEVDKDPADGVPDCWVLVSNYPNHYYLDTEEKVFGDRSLKMETYCTPSTPERIYTDGYGGARQWLEVKGSTTYTVSFYIKTDSPDKVRAWVGIWEGDALGHYGTYILLSPGWQRVAYTFTTSPGAAQIALVLGVRGFFTETVTQWYEGVFYTSWIDGVQLEEAGSASPFHVTFAGCAGVIPVEVDIKPGSDPNSINLACHGVIPVAILTTADFDAATVDPQTVFFAGTTPKHSALEDVDGDGDIDMILHFKCQEATIEPDAVACLEGQTYDGRTIQGCDSVRIVPPESPADSDGDGFTDAAEVCVGTDILDDCPDDVDDDAWPADLVHTTLGYGKHDGAVNILDIVQLMPPVFNTSPPDPSYSTRKDFNGDGSINVLDIVRLMPPVFNTSCTP